MGLLHEIQEEVVNKNADLASLLLKLRLLASRLESKILEEWVKHEAEGYPQGVEVPDYRRVEVIYSGTFSGPGGSVIKNTPIPKYLVQEFAGEQWVKYELRESIATVENLLRNATEREGSIGIDASNLILLLQGKVYENYVCNAVHGRISPTAVAEIRQGVRGRILELTVQLEKSVPESAEVTSGAADSSLKPNTEQVQQISQQVIYGNVTTAVTGGSGSNINVTVQQGDTRSFVDYLTNAGVPENTARELAGIVEEEEPESDKEPFGTKTNAWLGENLKRAAEGAWDIGVSTAMRVISEAALKYYGLK